MAVEGSLIYIAIIMKLSVKVLLYSGLVFPGAGYFILKKTLRATVAFAITIGCFLFIMKEVFYRANIVAEKIVQGDIPYDIAVVREQILLTSGALSEGTMSTLSGIIAIVWLVGLLDGYYLARRKESNESH